MRSSEIDARLTKDQHVCWLLKYRPSNTGKCKQSCVSISVLILWMGFIIVAWYTIVYNVGVIWASLGESQRLWFLLRGDVLDGRTWHDRGAYVPHMALWSSSGTMTGRSTIVDDCSEVRCQIHSHLLRLVDSTQTEVFRFLRRRLFIRICKKTR